MPPTGPWPTSPRPQKRLDPRPIDGDGIPAGFPGLYEVFLILERSNSCPNLSVLNRSHRVVFRHPGFQFLLMHFRPGPLGLKRHRSGAFAAPLTVW